MKDLVEKFLVKFFFFSVYSPWIRIRNRIWIRMDIFGILDSDPHKNLCGSETLLGMMMVTLS